MTLARQGVVAVVLAALLGGAAAAQEPQRQSQPPPRLVATTVLINVVYVPLRVALTTVCAFVGGFTGFITMGDEDAANAVFGLVNGPQVITPEMLAGTERWHLGAYD